LAFLEWSSKYSRKWLYSMNHCGDSISSSIEERCGSLLSSGIRRERLMRDRQMKLGVWFYGVGTALTGLLNIAWLAFDPSHQPIQALGKVPDQSLLACVAGVWLVAAGVAILRRRSAKIGAAACASAYLIFAAMYLPRGYAAVHAHGWVMGVLSIAFGLAQQVMLIAPAAIVYASFASTDSVLQARTMIAGRWMLGVPPIVFGLLHLVGIRVFASIVPRWMGFGHFWAAITGIAFILAGAAICLGIKDVLAARLLALMLLLFEGLVEVPPIFSRLHNQATWGAATYNVAAIGACLIFAEFVASRADRGRIRSAGNVAMSRPDPMVV
jgi:hypothetical protein